MGVLFFLKIFCKKEGKNDYIIIFFLFIIKYFFFSGDNRLEENVFLGCLEILIYLVLFRRWKMFM